MRHNKWNKSLTKNVILPLSVAIFLSITGNAFSDEIPNDCRSQNVVMQNFSDMKNKNFKCKFIKKVVVIFRFFRKNGEPILLLDGISGKELHKIREGLKSDLKFRIERHLKNKDGDATVDFFFNDTPFPLSDDMVVLSIGVFFSSEKISIDKGSAAIIADRIFSENYPNVYGEYDKYLTTQYAFPDRIEVFEFYSKDEFSAIVKRFSENKVEQLLEEVL